MLTNFQSVVDTVRKKYNRTNGKKVKKHLFEQPPRIVTDFLKADSRPLILAINTAYDELVLNWINETVDHSIVVDRHRFVAMCDEKNRLNMYIQIGSIH